MTSHSAKSLFGRNIESAKECLALYDGVHSLKTQLQIEWVLRAGIVFVVSALDTYFHDKVRYRVGKSSLHDLPPALAKLEIPLKDLTKWDEATRKGNVIRNWVTDHLSVRPLQSQEAIADALKLANINALWDTIEPDKTRRTALLNNLKKLVHRRNQIAHEGDREQSRRSGKKLRSVDRVQLSNAITFAQDLVETVESAFPN
jgi:hypothetical protein